MNEIWCRHLFIQINFNPLSILDLGLGLVSR